MLLESAPTEPGEVATPGEGVDVTLVPWDSAAWMLPAAPNGSIAEHRRPQPRARCDLGE
jgi:hypothetical protein